MTDDQFLHGLRVRFDDAHRATPGADSPPPDLWNRILVDHNEGRSETMHATMPPERLPVHSAPRSRRTIRLEERSRPSTRFGYAAVAAILVLTLLGGVFIANQRGPGGGDVDGLRYAAQPVSPEASSISSQTCDVEPMTVDEVMAIVEDPYVNMDVQQLNIIGFPTFLTEQPSLLTIPVEFPDDFGEAPDPEDEEEAREITASYLACRQSGSLGQVFALMSPNKVQQVVFGRFPAFRGEVEVRAFLESALPAPAQQVMFSPVFETDVTIVPATGEDTALTWSPFPPYPVVFIGTEAIDASGNVIAVSDARDNVRAMDSSARPRSTLGAVSLVQYPGVDQWYVNDEEIVRVTDTVQESSSPEVAVCVAEPMTAETLHRLLDDPNAYAEEVYGTDVITPEGAALLEDIQHEPDSLVLASVTGDGDEVMLVMPQEGVLPAAGNYLDCWQEGTAAEAFALMAPHMIAEYDSLVDLPRDAEALQALLDAPARDLPAFDRIMPTFVLDEGRTAVVADTGETHGYAEAPGGFEVAFVATNTNDREGNALIGGNIDDRSLDWSGESTEVDGQMSFGALTLIRYPGTEQWLVYDHWIEVEPTPMQLP